MTKERPQSLLQVISLIEPFKLMKNSLYLLFRVLKVPETITPWMVASQVLLGP